MTTTTDFPNAKPSRMYASWYTPTRFLVYVTGIEKCPLYAIIVTTGGGIYTFRSHEELGRFVETNRLIEIEIEIE